MIKQLLNLGRIALNQQRRALNFRQLCFGQKFYFTQGTQSLDDLRNKLAELNTKYQEIEGFDQKQKVMQEIIDVKMLLNQILFPHKQSEGKYEGYRRDQLVLAQLNFENDNREECQKILNDIMSGDYEHEFKDHKEENEAFLAGLYIIHCMSNLDKLSIAEQSAAKAYEHSQYFIENNCPIYQKAIQDQIPDSEKLLEDELQYLQNYVSNLMIYSKICQERGKLNESIQKLGEAATVLDNIGHLFRKIFSKQIQVKTQLEEEELKKFFMSVLVNEAITLKGLAKSCLRAKRFDDTKNLIEAATNYFTYLIEQKLLYPHDENYISLLFDTHEYLTSTGAEQALIDETKAKIDEIIIKLKETDQTLATLLRYEIMLYKYYFESNLERINDLIKKFQQDVPTQIELNQSILQALLQNGDLKSALFYCEKQLEILKECFDSSHSLYGENLLNMLEIWIVQKDFDKAKNCIVQLSAESHNMVYAKDLEQIVKLQRLRVEFLEKFQSNQLDQINKTLEKIESLVFTNFQDSYTKSYILSQFYQGIGNKQMEKEKLIECLNILQQDVNFGKRESLIKEFQEKIAKLQ